MDEAGLQKIDSINRKLAPAVIFAAVTAWFFQAFIMGSDLFWHLSAGRDIWERGHVPETDPFSYTFGGQHWANHEWLWDVIYWKVYQLGPDAVAWFTIAINVTIFTLVYLRAFKVTESVFATGLAVWLAAITCYWFLDIRPHVVTLLMVSIVLATRDKRWAPWLWPPLITLWTNLHAGFIFGIGMVGLLVLVRTIEASWKAPQLAGSWTEWPWWQWLSVACCLVAWLINPYGWRIAEFQLDYFFHDSVYRDLIEWKPPDFGLDPSYYHGCFWWFLILAVIGAGLGLWTGRMRDAYAIALSIVTVMLAVRSRRFIPLFVVCSTPFVAITLLMARDALAKRIAFLRSPWAGVGATLVAAVVAINMWSHINLRASLLRQWAMGEVYPEEAIQYLNALGPPEKILNHYNWGGLLMLRAPGAKLFIDGRANTLYDEAIYRDYIDFCNGQVDASRLLRYKADVAFLPIRYFSTALQKLTPPWQPIYRDSAIIILAPPGSPLLSKPLPDFREVLKDGIEPLLADAIAAFDRGQYQHAIQILEHVIERAPHSIRAYGFLARAYAKLGQFDKVDEVINAGLRENPRQYNTLYLHQAGIYREAGQYERALEAYYAGRLRGPFSRHGEYDTAVRQIKAEIERKKRGF